MMTKMKMVGDGEKERSIWSGINMEDFGWLKGGWVSLFIMVTPCMAQDYWPCLIQVLHIAIYIYI